MNDYTLISTYAMATSWEVRIHGVTLSLTEKQLVESNVQKFLSDFENLYSRFKKDSLITSLSQKSGVFEVPSELVNMLTMYEKVYTASDGRITPLVGSLMEDIGYDSAYSLEEKSVLRPVNNLNDVIQIVDDHTLEMKQPGLLDLGALGKGYAVGKLGELLQDLGFKNALINGSGDLLAFGPSTHTVGLEHPRDPSQAIGTISLQNKALASSGTIRRQWKNRHHIVNPLDGKSPMDIVATWVLTDDSGYADILATSLFLVPPAQLASVCDFEYLVVDADMKSHRSKGFQAELF